ncbi:hypothetical protein HK102_005896, partial [Quaeritorhiza haematococci]
MSLLAVPSVIELPKYGGRYEAVREEVERNWSETVLDVVRDAINMGAGQPPAGSVPWGKRYVTVAWIKKVPRNRGRNPRSSSGSSSTPNVVAMAAAAAAHAAQVSSGGGATDKSRRKNSLVPLTEQVPWLVRLALEGTVAPNKPLEDLDNGKNGEDRRYVGFCIAEWDRARGAVFMIQITPRSVFSPTLESYGELLRRTIERIQADARREETTFPPPIPLSSSY